MLLQKMVVLYVVSLLVIACSGSKDAVFLGKWERIANKYNQTGGFEIVKNGDTLLMVEKEEKYSAKIGDDGTLQMSGPFGIVSYSYISETDTIIGIGKEYRRVK
jgi:hypothetical protein